MGRRAAALALLALLVAGCQSSAPQRHEPLPADGPAGVVRVGLAARPLAARPDTRARTRRADAGARALRDAAADRPGQRGASARALLRLERERRDLAPSLPARRRDRHPAAAGAALPGAAHPGARRAAAGDRPARAEGGASVPPDPGGGRASGSARPVPAHLGEPGARGRRAARPATRGEQARAPRGAASLPGGQARRGAGAARRPARLEARSAARGGRARPPPARRRHRRVRRHRPARGAPRLRRHRRPRRLPGARARVRGPACGEPDRSQPPEGERSGDRPARSPQGDPVAASHRRPLRPAGRPRPRLRARPARRGLARPRPGRGRRRPAGREVRASPRAVPEGRVPSRRRPRAAGRADRLGGGRAAGLTPPARLARGPRWAPSTTAGSARPRRPGRNRRR